MSPLTAGGVVTGRVHGLRRLGSISPRAAGVAFAIAALVLGLVARPAPASAAGGTYAVTSCGDFGGAPDELRHIVEIATPGSVIQLGCDVELRSQLEIAKTLTITNGGGPVRTIRAASGVATRLLHVTAGDLTLQDVALSGGQSIGAVGWSGADGNRGGGAGGLARGGAILSETTGTVTLRNVTLAANVAQGGQGGNGYYDPWLTVADWLKGDAGERGEGGVYGGAGGTVDTYSSWTCVWWSCESSPIGDQYVDGPGGGGAALGGAIHVASGTLVVEGGFFTGNRATGGAAGNRYTWGIQDSEMDMSDACDSGWDGSCFTLESAGAEAAAGEGKGGAIFVAPGATAHLSNVAMHGNVATTSRSVVCALWDTPELCGDVQVQSLVAGDASVCRVRGDGTQVCWGSDASSILATANGMTAYRFSPLGLSGENACGIAASGAMVCWGRTMAGVNAPPAGAFRAVSVGTDFACAIRFDGTVACWGDDSYGRVGGAPGGQFSEIAAGAHFACALRLSDGHPVCWGAGPGTPPSASLTRLTAGAEHACGIGSDGTPVCWGNGADGRTAAPSAAVTRIDAGGNHTCALRPNGTLLCWGADGYGQVSGPNASAAAYTNVVTGASFTCATRSDGNLDCWGLNDRGQAPRISIAPATLPAPLIAKPYSQTVTARVDLLDEPGTPTPDGSGTIALVSGALPTGLSLGSDGVMSGTPSHAGTYTFSLRTSYSQSIGGRTAFTLGATRAYTLVVTNAAPVAWDDTVTIDEDMTPSIAVLANDTDADGNITSVSVVSGPSNGATQVFSNLEVRYVPYSNWHGTDGFTYRVCDSDGLCDDGLVTITVNSVEDVPDAESDTYVTRIGTTLNVDAARGVLANDFDGDGDPLTAALLSAPASGDLTFHADGSFTYVPAPGFAGTLTFGYRASDGDDQSAPATVTIKVNTPPTATADSYVAARNTALIVPASSGLLANDVEVDTGDSAWIASNTSPAHGSVAITSDGSFTYTPAAGYAGPDTFTYVITDGHDLSSPATVSIRVNIPPTAVDDSYTVLAGALSRIPAASGVLANDTDADGGTLSAVGSHGDWNYPHAEHGIAYVYADGSFIYQPAGGHSGPDSFQYKVSDGSHWSAPATVHLIVDAPPVAAADAYSVAKNTTLTVPPAGVLANDTDADANPLTAVLVAGPGHGALALHADGSFVYTPDARFSGNDTFAYTANDGFTSSAQVTVTIAVGLNNVLPVASDTAVAMDEDTALDIVPSATDANGDDLTFRVVSGPAHGSVSSGAATLAYNPNANFFGTDSFTVVANDGFGDSNLVTVTITVRSVNDPPVALDDTAETAEDAPVTIAVLANDSDVEGDTLVISSIDAPAHGTAIANGDGTITYTPNAEFNGVETFTYHVSDGHGGTDTAAVAVTVGNVDDPPVASDGTVSTASGTPVAVTLHATDPDSTALRYVTTAGPSHGTYSGVGPDLTYTPTAGFGGSDSIGFAVTDLDPLIAGGAYTCATRLDGTLECWGESFWTYPWPTPPSGPFVQVSAGSVHMCGLRPNGTIVCWGSGTANPETPPVGTFTRIDAGWDWECGLAADGHLVCAGRDGQGYNLLSPPSGTFTRVSTGQTFGCAIRTNGTLACWGNNGVGELNAPSGTFLEVSAGARHACAIRTDHSIACWGFNIYGQATAPSGQFVDVQTGASSSCGLRPDGTITCWGSNFNGERNAPAGTFIRMAVGDRHACALRVDGAILCWGGTGAWNYGQTVVPADLSGTPYASHVDTAAVTIHVGPPKPVLTVRADDRGRTYGAPDASFAATISGFVGGDTLATSGVTGSPACTTTATAASPVGSYPITCTVGTLASSKYDFAFAPGTLSVEPATLVVGVADAARVYGTADPAFVTTIAGFVNDETLATSGVTGSATCTAGTPSTPIGPHPITCTTGTLAAANYVFVFTPGTLLVAPATLTVTAADATRAYGAADPSFAATIGGFVNGETAVTAGMTGIADCATAATAMSPVGTYSITCAVGSLAAPNYSFAFAAGSLTVTPATLTVHADGARSYGEADAPLSPSFEGFANGETLATAGITGSPSCATAATRSSPVGSYETSCSIGSLAASNYAFAFATGTLTIAPATLTVRADDAARTYGSGNPSFTASIDGFANGETPATSGVTGGAACTTAATTASPAGTYAIDCAIGTLAAGNYVFAFEAGTLTVGPAALTVRAADASRAYGAANPPLGATITGFANGESLATSGVTGTAACTTAATPASPVGTYPIGCAIGTLQAANYAFDVQPGGTLSVTPATLAVLAGDASRAYGAANPVIGATITGFVNGETLATSGVTGSPLCAADASERSPVGTYRTFCGGATLAASNYQFELRPGALNVTPATLTVRADDRTREAGSPNPAFTATIAGFVNDETLATSGVTGGPSCTTSATAASPAGGYPITCTIGTLAAANYGFSFLPGTLTVVSTATVTAVDPATSTYSEGPVSVTLHAAVASGGSPVSGGTVTFAIRAGSATIATTSAASVASGAASAQVTLPGGTPVGAYTIEATYTPGAGLTGSSGTATLTIGKRATTVGAANATAPAGATSVSLRASVAATPNGSSSVNAGTVTFTVKQGGSTIGTATTSASVAAGAASVTYALPSGTAPGTYTIEASYGGAAGFLASAGTATLTIEGGTGTTIVLAAPAQVQYSDVVRLTATVGPRAVGGRHPSGTVRFALNGSPVGTAAVDRFGRARLSVRVMLPAGTYPLTATFTSTSAAIGGSATARNIAVVTEDASLEYAGDAIGRTGTTVTLRAVFTDSGSPAYHGPRDETARRSTIGDITNGYVAFDVFATRDCSGTPVASPTARVVDDGIRGDGVGAATVTFTSPIAADNCVRPRLVGADGSPNGFYKAPIARAGALAFADEFSGSVAGSGWLAGPKEAAGFVTLDARTTRAGEAPQGRLEYRWQGTYKGVAASFVVRGTSLTALGFDGATPSAATIQGIADLQVTSLRDHHVLYTSRDGTFLAIAVDGRHVPHLGTDRLSLTFTEKDAAAPYLSFAAVPVRAGSIVIHVDRADAGHPRRQAQDDRAPNTPN